MIDEYVVNRDKFEPDTDSYFCFPCNCCKHRFGADSDEPCRTCDHNSNSDDYDSKGTAA